VAAALHDRALTLDQFEPVRYVDPQLRRFAEETVEIKVDAALSGAEAVVEIGMSDGKNLSARCEHPRGSFANPLSRAEIEQKFRTYAKDRLPAARIEEVIAAVNRLEHFPSVRTLMDLLRHGSHRSQDERAA